MNKAIPLAAALAFALAACSPSAPEDAQQQAQAPDGGDAMANDPAAPPPMDQPGEDVPPATAPAGPLNQAPDLGQVRMDGYGDMRFGMSADEAKQAWGGELKGVPAEDGGCYYLVPRWVDTPSDFAFMIEGDRFVRYDIGTDREIAPGGGKVGMGIDELRQLYAGRFEETPHKYVEGGRYLEVADGNGGQGRLVFATDAGGRVTSWRVGVPPQVGYVEGCG